MVFYQSKNIVEALTVLGALASLNAFYPDFEHWYINKALPGIALGTDKLLIARDGEQLAGIALAKKTKKETKLRCVRVMDSYQQSGLGIKLIDRMIDIVQDPHPHCTVAEELFHTYSRLFVNRYGFKLDAVEKGLYRSAKLEYIFNKR